jgi:hydrogenase expression/formation protein HypC
VCDFNGVRRVVNIACVRNDGQSVEDLLGAWVLVHVGFAMARVDEAEAFRTLRLLTELGEAQRELEVMSLSAAN